MAHWQAMSWGAAGASIDLGYLLARFWGSWGSWGHLQAGWRRCRAVSVQSLPNAPSHRALLFLVSLACLVMHFDVSRDQLTLIICPLVFNYLGTYFATVPT